MPCIGVAGEVEESKQFEWKISDFFALSEDKLSFYRSPSFVFDKTSFHLNIFPGGNICATHGYISLILKNESECPVHVIYELHIKKADGQLIAGSGVDTTLKRFVDWNFLNFYPRSDLLENKSELVPSGILTIVCVMKCSKDEKEVVKADNVEILHQKQSCTPLDYKRLTEIDILSENLRELSTNKDSCDAVLKVEDKEFKAHTAILIARSRVFAAMFQHDTLEKQTGIVNISDCDSESFQEFLDYLYCGKLEDVSFRSAFHLYSTSKKYDVQELKEFCMEYMKNSLTIDNICDVVILAGKHDEIELMAKIQDFFNEKYYKIIPTSEWDSLMKNHLSLASKLLVAFSKSKESQ